MTDQLFYFNATSNDHVRGARFRLAMFGGKLKYIHLTAYSVLIHVTHEREKPFQTDDLLPKKGNTDAWAVEIAPAQVDGLIHDYFQGAEPSQMDEPICEEEDLTECHVDRVLDRINKHGLNGIQASERRMLDRYAEHLRLLGTRPTRPSGRHR